MEKSKKQQGKSVKIDNETYEKILAYKNKHYVPIAKIIKLSIEEYIQKKEVKEDVK